MVIPAQPAKPANPVAVPVRGQRRHAAMAVAAVRRGPPVARGAGAAAAPVRLQPSASVRGRKKGSKGRTITPARRGAAGRTTRGKRPAPTVALLPRAVTIKALDPQRKCGPDTSVLHMFRVDETLGGRHADTHLVFFDRHGWYCAVHGRGCRAVEDVRKQGGFKHVDLANNGRMRA